MPLHEEHYRTSAFDGSEANPSAGGLPGAVQYEGFGTGRCNCTFQHPYPYAFGPRLGFAYMVTPKTVFRGGWGLVYGAPDATQYQGESTSPIDVGYNTLNFSSPSFGVANTVLENGFNFTPAQLYSAALSPGAVPVAGTVANFPSPWFDPQGARPSRINTWNLTVQRQITPNLLAEVAYVGNRGVWELSGDPYSMELNNINALSLQRIASFGLDPTNAADQALLMSTYASGAPQAAGFQVPYAGFPTGLTLAQGLRPYPQFDSIYSMFSPLGKSWYDALQAKVTNRFSHGLSMLASFTYSKTLNLASDYHGEIGAINDSFDKSLNKDVSWIDLPFNFSIAFTYHVPTPAALHSNRFTRGVFGGWELGGVEQIYSGLPIEAPGSNNNLAAITTEGTFVNRVPGVSPYLINPNSIHNPSAYATQSVLNPAAWVDTAPGTWGNAAAYYDYYRWQRQHNEQANLAKNFKLGEHANLSVRVEMFNVFNRVSLGGPSSGNIALPASTEYSGFGDLYPSSGAPRTGQLVGRITF
jgi:hypothetical protein